MTSTKDTFGAHELDARAADGLEVRLLWRKESDEVLVEIQDTSRSQRWCFEVAGHNAMDAFRHPFAYAARA